MRSMTTYTVDKEQGLGHKSPGRDAKLHCVTFVVKYDFRGQKKTSKNNPPPDKAMTLHFPAFFCT